MDTFIYFAYGSNMLTERLRARCPSAGPVGTAVARCHDIQFTKESRDKSGKATLIDTGDNSDVVCGVLFRINKDELTALDRIEGKGNGYDRKDEFPVISSDREVCAITYLAEKVDKNQIPYYWYFALVLAGALQHNLSSNYVEKLLKDIKLKSDPEKRRKNRIEAICFLERAGYKTVYQELTEK